MTARGGGQGGFTLLELMVAITIFAIVSVMAYTGLNTVLNAKQQTRERAAELAELQRAFNVISADFLQAAPRPIRDHLGQTQPAMSTSVEGVEFTRAGRINPMGVTRSEFERVGYLLGPDDELLRRSWQGLDQSFEPTKRDRVLLTGVERLSIRFLGTDSQWLEQWPPAGAQDLSTLPRAVELSITIDEYAGELRRVFALPEGR